MLFWGNDIIGYNFMGFGNTPLHVLGQIVKLGSALNNIAFCLKFSRSKDFASIEVFISIAIVETCHYLSCLVSASDKGAHLPNLFLNVTSIANIDSTFLDICWFRNQFSPS